MQLPANNAFERLKWVHELDVMETFGYSWSTWERCYRTEIPGRTTPNGRFYRQEALDKWFMENETTRDSATQT